MARPTKYTEERAAQIATLLRGGCTRKDAVGSIGVDYHTFLNWLSQFSSFSTLITSAESFAAVRMTTLVTKAAEQDAKFALEWLKRRRRDEWGDNVAVSLPNLEEFDDDELDRIAAGEPIERVSASSRSRRAGKTPTSAGQIEQSEQPPLIA